MTTTTLTSNRLKMQPLEATEKTIIAILGFYFIVLCAAAFKLLPPLAIYYYWDWGRHLALSYFDNPPMIAYMLRAITTVFGNHIYVLNLFAVGTAYAIALFVFHTTRLIASRKAAFIAMLIWLCSPMITQYIINYNTYDTPLNLFWAMTIFFTVRYIQQKKTTDIYWLGLGVGLMLLTKYTGIILVLGLLITFISIKPLRSAFKNIHFYLTTLMALFIFSPVLIWNYQHDWISFVYQLHTHASGETGLLQQIKHSGHMLLKSQLPMFNILLAIVIYGAIKTKPITNQHNAIIALILITATFSLFYIVAALKADVLTSWILPGIIGLAILTGYFWEKRQLHKTLCILLPIYFALSTLILLANTVFASRLTKAGATYTMMQAFNQAFPSIQQPIFTTDYSQARIVFFINGQPNIYTFPHCFQENQYQFWSKEIVAAVRTGKINQALYVVDSPKTDCAKTLFNHIALINKITVNQFVPLSHKRQTKSLYVYQLSNA